MKDVIFLTKGQNVDTMGLLNVKELLVYTEKKFRFSLMYDTVSGKVLTLLFEAKEVCM